MIKLDKSAITKNLGRKYKLVPYLEKAFNDFDEPWEYKYEEKLPDTAWHPSGHCTPLVSDLYAIAQGADSFGSISSSLRKSFQVGHFWHQLLQYIVRQKLEMCESQAIERKAKKEWGEQITCEGCKGKGTNTIKLDGTPFRIKDMCKKCTGVGKYLPPYHSVTGSADIAPLDAPNWSGGVDFKTSGSHAFKQVEVPFADKYEAQANIYMDLFDEDEWLIVTINKDTPHDMREFCYRRNSDLTDMIYKKWKHVSLLLDAGEKPTIADDETYSLDGLFRGPYAS